MDNISLQYFKTQPKASTKQLTWHNTMALLNVELIHKPGQNNVVLDALNTKEKFQMEKPLTKTQALKAIFQGENSLERRIKEAYV